MIIKYTEIDSINYIKKDFLKIIEAYFKNYTVFNVYQKGLCPIGPDAKWVYSDYVYCFHSNNRIVYCYLRENELEYIDK